MTTTPTLPIGPQRLPKKAEGFIPQNCSSYNAYVAPPTPTLPTTHNTPHPKSCAIHPVGRHQTQRRPGVSPDRVRGVSHAAGFSLRYGS